MDREGFLLTFFVGVNRLCKTSKPTTFFVFQLFNTDLTI